MKYMVTKGVVFYDGGRHQKGESFEADPLQMTKLVAGGFVLPIDPAPASESNEKNDPKEPENPEDPDTIELPTPEEFASWKAEGQKKLLADAGIEPASNAEGRIEQFAQLYESAEEE